LVGATLLDERLLVIAGIPLTLIAGALLDTWWAALVPSVATAALFLVLYVSDPSCSDCGEDPYDIQILTAAFYFVAPATALMAIGVAARRLAYFFRDLPAGDERRHKNA
jgi:hypothetical protein